MSFFVSNTSIENYKLVQSLVTPAEAGPNSAVTYEYPAVNAGYSGYLSNEQLSSGTIHLINADGNLLILPSSVELSNLFTNPVPGSVRNFNLSVDDAAASVDVWIGEESQTLSGSTLYQLSLQVATGPSDPTGTGAAVELKYMSYFGSISMPIGQLQEIPSGPSGTGINWLTSLSAGPALPPTLVLGGTPGAGKNVIFASTGTSAAINLWGKLFGNASMPSVGVVYVPTISLINKTGQTMTLTNSGASGANVVYLIGGNVSLPDKQVADLAVKFIAKSATSAEAQAVATVRAFIP